VWDTECDAFRRENVCMKRPNLDSDTLTERCATSVGDASGGVSSLAMHNAHTTSTQAKRPLALRCCGLPLLTMPCLLLALALAAAVAQAQTVLVPCALLEALIIHGNFLCSLQNSTPVLHVGGRGVVLPGSALFMPDTLDFHLFYQCKNMTSPVRAASSMLRMSDYWLTDAPSRLASECRVVSLQLHRLGVLV
jgi:hypothetical protein